MKRAAFYIAVSIAASLLAGFPPALAQEGEAPEGGFSAYSVARVKVLDGSVWVRPSDGRDWEEFSSNSPIPPRSRVSVPEGSEAELQFHGGQFVLLTSGTDLEIRDFQEGISEFRLRAGEIRFDLPPDDFAPVTVRMPGGAVARFPEPGRQWLTVTDDEETRLVVRRGQAVVTLDGEEYPLRAGEEAYIGEGITVGQYRGGEVDTASAPPPSEPVGDAPPAVVNELSEYGEWVDVPEYGYAWRPRVAAGWSPYVYGRWVWISPYGWTWVSYEPWGWYPYRCGFWLTDPVFGWIWSPYNSFVSVNFVFGSHRYRHHNVFFRPATVRFIPEGRNVRWVPLRPGERFRPAEFRRGDARLSRWNRPLDSGRVFVRGGQDRRQWRDYKVVHTERQAEIRKTRTAQPRPDNRRVRPEARGSRPSSAVGGRKSAEPRRRDRDLRDRGNRPGQGDGRGIRGMERRPAAPSGRPARESGGKVVRPQQGTGVSRDFVPRPGNVERRALPPRNVPAARSPENQRGRRPEPMIDRSEAPRARPEGGRAIVQERKPAGRGPVPEPRGQETRVNRGGDDGGGRVNRGGDDGGGRVERGGDRGGGRVERGGDRGGGRGDDRGGDRGGGGRWR